MTTTPVDAPPRPGRYAWVLFGLGSALVFGVVAGGGRPSWALYGLFLLLAATALVGLLILPRPTRRVALIAGLLGLLLLRLATAPVVGTPGLVLTAVALIGLGLSLALGERYPRAVPALVTVIVVVGALEAAWVLMQGAAGPDPIGAAFRDGEPPTGTFTNRNHLAAFLNLSLALSVGLLLAGLARRRQRHERSEVWGRAWLGVLGIALVALAVLLTRSRGGAISLAVTLGFIAVLSLFWGRRARPRMPAVALGLLALTVLSLGLAVGPERLSRRFAEIGSSDRPALYRDTLSLIGDHPVGGVGAGMYRWRFRPYQTTRLDLWYTHAHNDYLEVAADWGVPLALALWGFVGWRWLAAARRALAADDSPARGVALGCAAAMLAILVHGLIDFNLHIPATLLAFSLLVGVSWTLAPHGPAVEPALPPPSARRGEIAVRAALALLLSLAGWRVAGLLLAEARILRAQTAADLESAAQAAPAAPEPHFRLGLAYRDLPALSDPARAREHLERAVALNPWSWSYWLELAALEERTGRPDAAERALREAVRRNPRSGRYRWRLANFLLRHDRAPEALPELRTALFRERDLLEPGWSLMAKLGLPFRDAATVWPAGPAERLDLLRRAAAAGRPEDRQGILEEWDRLLGGPSPPEISEGSFLLEYLLQTGSLAEARERWAELAAAAGWTDTLYSTGSSAVWNGGFELPLAPSPLAWKTTPRAGGSVSRVAGEGPDGSTALRLDLPSGSTGQGPQVGQLAAAEGGRQYTLSYSLRCLRLADTDGFRMEVRDGESDEILAAADEARGSTPWRTYSTRFHLSERATPVRVVLTGGPGAAPQGGAATVWLDRVVLEPSS